MKHTYHINGMSCKGCKSHVEEILSKIDGVSKVTVDLEKEDAIIETEEHFHIEKYQEALKKDGDTYTIHNIDDLPKKDKDATSVEVKKVNGNGKYYCPMHCEGEKVYDKAGDCPVCGMDLVQQPVLHQSQQYTCPMHPEIVRDEPGSCPICGMDLVPMEPSESEDQKSYKDLVKKMKFALIFTIPVFIIAMSEMIPNNPLEKIMDIGKWNWVQFFLSLPVVFYACWMFFVRAWKSIITWNLNMFTLIGIGTGVAFLFSIFGLFFPEVFPAEFKTANGTVHLYFEATVVILTLVLLGQLMEAKAHSQTSGAIKALLKLAPSEAVLVVEGQDKVVSMNR